jgi:uncharacterized membrane protein YhdT
VQLTRHFIAAPSVENAWLDYLFGGLLCAGAVAERRGTTGNPIPWFAIAAFIAIALFPVLAFPWSWFAQFM